MFMNILIDGQKVEYETEGSGKDILLLHGWGVNRDTMRPVFDFLRESCRVTMLDFPGFGESDLPSSVWDVYEYADFTARFIEALELKNPVIMGHSFGGRIALILSAKRLTPIHKLILVDSAGIRPKRGIGYFAKVYAYKGAKKAAHLLGLFSTQMQEKIQEKFGSTDYKNASPIMRSVMVKVVNEDLTTLLKDVAQPTLLIWGEKDDATPLADAKLMEKRIPDAGLIVLKGAGHYSFLEQLGYFKLITLSFLGNE